MSLGDGAEAIADEELLYRRIPVSQGWYDPAIGSKPSPLAFRPRKEDCNGLSLSRAKYKNLENAARGPSKHGYFVAVLRAKDLRAYGIDVAPCPLNNDPGHCEIPRLTSAIRDEAWAKEWIELLAKELCLSVEGPFSPSG